MNVTDFYLALVIGLTISLLIEEFIGVSAGGMIVPGYLAMVCDDLKIMLIIFIISFITYLIVEFILPRFVILFGKRKFVATLVIGLVIKLAVELCFPMLPFASVAFRGVGVITPGLIANSYTKQGIKYTLPAVLIAAYLTFGIVTLLHFIF